MEPLVLEDWLRLACSSTSSASSARAPASTQAAAPQLPANAIVHAWSQIRAFLQERKALTSADAEPFELLNQHRTSLHLADSQAKLLQSLLSDVSSSDAALLGFVRRFAIVGLLAWVRKSFTAPGSAASATTSKKHPAPEILASIVQSVRKAMEERPLSDQYTCEAILLLGAILNLQSVSVAVRNDCLSAIARELVGRREVITRGAAIAEALAGAGYALTVSSQEHLVAIFQALLLLWTESSELLPSGSKVKFELDNSQRNRERVGSILKDQVMLLHLMDFLGSIFLSRQHSQTAIGLSQVDVERIHDATLRMLENNPSDTPFVQCTSTMACVGLLKSLHRWDQGNRNRGIPSSPVHHQKWFTIIGKLQSVLVKICEQAMGPDVETFPTFLAGPIPGPAGVSMLQAGNRFLCRCVSVAVSRCGGLPAHPSILRCLLFSIFGDALSLDSLYSVFTSELATGAFGAESQQQLREKNASEEEKVLAVGSASNVDQSLHDFQVHLDSFFLQEIGAIARAMCDQYRSTSGDLRGQTEHLVSDVARSIYEKHRLLVSMSQSFKKQVWIHYRQTLEKVLETAFITVVIFFSIAVEEQVPNCNDGELAALALDSLSCVEFFRRVQLRDFSKLVQRSVTHIAASEASSVFLANLLPAYEDIIKKPGTPDFNLPVSWGQDEVQTARLLFYFRILPLCLIKMPEATFAAEIAPAMFLYLHHPSETVSKASHALFGAFLSLGVRSDPPVILGAKKSQSSSSRPEIQITLREQLSVYYMQRTLEAMKREVQFLLGNSHDVASCRGSIAIVGVQGFPGVTPYQGLIAGAGAITRHLPPGSPVTVYCLNCLVDKIDTLYNMDGGSRNLGQNEGKQSQTGTSDQRRNFPVYVRAAQKLQFLLLHLILLVDLQVFPVLLKLVAKLILGLPKPFQTVALAEAYDVVGCTDDYTRKPTIVPWLQSLSFLCARSQTVSKDGHGDRDSNTPETRSVEVSNPESTSKSQSVDVTSEDVVFRTAEDGKQSGNLETVVEGPKVRHSGDPSTGNLISDNNQAGRDDNGSEPRSKL